MIRTGDSFTAASLQATTLASSGVRPLGIPDALADHGERTSVLAGDWLGEAVSLRAEVGPAARGLDVAGHAARVLAALCGEPQE